MAVRYRLKSKLPENKKTINHEQPVIGTNPAVKFASLPIEYNPEKEIRDNNSSSSSESERDTEDHHSSSESESDTEDHHSSAESESDTKDHHSSSSEPENEITNINSSSLIMSSTSKRSDWRKDQSSIGLLLFLYILQGVPLGMAASIPLIIQTHGTSWSQQATFSFAFWPFSLKLLWAPIVDALYFKRYGRRKSWLIPVQYLIGFVMILLSYHINDLLYSTETSVISQSHIYYLTAVFFGLSFLAATQDICVDGWALSMLSRENVGWASTCNSVGQTAGYFLGNAVFLAFESKDFSNLYVRRPLHMEFQPTGLITLPGFLTFWGIAFLISTTLVALLKHEIDESYDPNDPHFNLGETYRVLLKALRLPSVRSMALILLTARVGFAATDSMTGLELVERGVTRESLALLAIPITPLQIVLPFIISKYTTGSQPLNIYIKSYPFRVMVGIIMAVFVYITPSFQNSDKTFPWYYYTLAIIIYAIHQIFLYNMFVSQMAFFALVSDPKIGGTYMTLLNTLSNLGRDWASTTILYLAHYLTNKKCSIGSTRCVTEIEEKTCQKLGGTCDVSVDPYYIEVFMCTAIAIIWFLWKYRALLHLQYLPMSAWQHFPLRIYEIKLIDLLCLRKKGIDDAMFNINACNMMKSLFTTRIPILLCRLHRLQARSFSVSLNFHKSWQKIQKQYMAEPEAKSTLAELNPPPEYIPERIKIWQELKTKYHDYVAAQPQVDITITLPDGKILPGKSWKTTPHEIAMGISQGLAAATVIAKVNGDLWDLDRPFEKDATLELIKFDDDQGKQVFWHSTAHIMGEAMELCYGGCLCYGPPIEQGFYYDMYLENRTVSGLDYDPLEKVMKKIVKEEQPFERLEISKEDLLRLFGYNPFKVRILNEKVHTPTTTVYRCGPLIDLCRGPHIRHTGKVKAFSITKNSSTYWEGDQARETLQRIYGISFPDTKQLKEWKHLQEEAAKRNHRKIGVEQDLFFFHELSPGSCFFYPKGAHIYNKLIDFLRAEYRKRGYQEVISPNIYNAKLWKVSGHWDHYSENMFKTEIEKEVYALKPMNCPGHCLIFSSRLRSWRELPLRMADFGVLHRNEASGALSGLTRVRRFQQDDAHIFCAQSQIKTEIEGCLDFLKQVYGIFGFTFELKLSTRPDKFLGEIETWNLAESQLSEALNSFGYRWKIDPGDGAFYGPKIDITIRDALQRAHQCATIQLDFQLPQRFQLQFQTNEQGELQSPVIIHRAILGSMERMLAILTESFGGKWPFWLSPRQMAIVPIFPSLDSYAQEVQKKLWLAGFQVDCDLDSGTTLNKKIRQNQLAQYNFIGVVGQAEQANGTINIRTRDNKQHGEFTIDEVIKRFSHLAETRTNHAEDEFAGPPVDSNAAEATSKLEATSISESHDDKKE
ncbi:unnamed protein product [Rotaria socialis]|uniref:threonine--tRNA ligase n=2 Tax=Rotaria socialis TaxID=392032 RepID=A0A817XPQ4_9BILA|nr:unnamed protein product [Rotaria socialis]